MIIFENLGRAKDRYPCCEEINKPRLINRSRYFDKDEDGIPVFSLIVLVFIGLSSNTLTIFLSFSDRADHIFLYTKYAILILYNGTMLYGKNCFTVKLQDEQIHKFTKLDKNTEIPQFAAFDDASNFIIRTLTKEEFNLYKKHTLKRLYFNN